MAVVNPVASTRALAAGAMLRCLCKTTRPP